MGYTMTRVNRNVNNDKIDFNGVFDTEKKKVEDVPTMSVTSK